MGSVTSLEQIEANQQNALKSTGPRTVEGKAVVSQNAVQHGLFSSGVVLDSEDPDEYRLLLDSLIDALKPVGSLEMTLVEKVAVILWRQRRLTAAETAKPVCHCFTSRWRNGLQRTIKAWPNMSRTPVCYGNACAA